jgi:hypothetical protein
MRGIGKLAPARRSEKSIVSILTIDVGDRPAVAIDLSRRGWLFPDDG